MQKRLLLFYVKKFITAAVSWNSINKFIQQSSGFIVKQYSTNLVWQILWPCDFETIRNSKLCVHNDCVCTITVYTRAGVREKYYYGTT